MAAIGRKNLKEQGTGPAPVKEKTKDEAEPIETGKQKTKNALKAITHILYNGRMYEPQEELPVDNAEMIEAWTDAGTAIWD